MLKALAKAALKKALDVVVVSPARRFPPVGRLVKYVAAQMSGNENSPPGWRRHEYERLRDIFVRRGAYSEVDAVARERLVERFEQIDRALNTYQGGTTSSSDGLFLAEGLLSLQVPGDVVECGCFMGGSTSKLSIVAKIVGRQLHVFDSFEGLPEVDEHNLHDLHARRPVAFMTPWTAGRYAARLEAVKGSVAQYGEIGVCTFVKGWLKDTLVPEHLPPAVAMAFTDVDLPSSARDCLLGLWPRLSDGGIYFSHDVGFIKVVQVLMDDHIWREVFREPTPILFGAGWGLGDSSPHLGFMVKGQQSAEYIKNLTLEK